MWICFCERVEKVLSGLMIGQPNFTGEERELLVKVEFSSPDSRKEPSLFLMKDFLSVTVTENGDSEMLQFKLDFLM